MALRPDTAAELLSGFRLLVQRLDEAPKAAERAPHRDCDEVRASARGAGGAIDDAYSCAVLEMNQFPFIEFIADADHVPVLGPILHTCM